MLYLILEIKFSRKSDFISVFTFKSNARETWCVILVSESWHILLRITALYTSFRSAQNHCLPDNVRPRGAFISVGDYTPPEKDLLLLTTCRSGSLLDWDKTWKKHARSKSIKNSEHTQTQKEDFIMSYLYKTKGTCSTMIEVRSEEHTSELQSHA